ncbi:MAG: hypothetical protein V3V00_03245 [Saprospiraceae bacterium]
MNRIVNITYIMVFVFSFFIKGSMNGQIDNQGDKKGQFDFWKGDWDVFKYGTDTLLGHSHIEVILNGFVIKESYSSSSSAYEGTSLSKFNSLIDKWEQYWVDNTGATLHLKGHYINDKMILSNQETHRQRIVHNRLTWTNLNGTGVRQKWEQSRDGKRWRVIFDGHYLPKN